MGEEFWSPPLGPPLLPCCSNCRLGDLFFLVETQLGAFTQCFEERANVHSHAPGRHAFGQAQVMVQRFQTTTCDIFMHGARHQGTLTVEGGAPQCAAARDGCCEMSKARMNQFFSNEKSGGKLGARLQERGAIGA